MDFGLALDLRAKTNLQGGPVGTPGYWAPEQARGEPATPASDLYALGLIAYRLFSGQPLVLGSKLGMRSVPPPYRPVVSKCLEPLPERRCASSSELRRALERARPRRGGMSRPRYAAAVVLALGLTVGAWTVVERGRVAARPSAAPTPAAVIAPVETIIPS